MKSSLRSYILNFVVIIGLTAVSLWFALKDNYHEIMHLISSISWYWLLIIFLWGMIYVMILGQIIMIFARRYKKDYTERFSAGLHQVPRADSSVRRTYLKSRESNTVTERVFCGRILSFIRRR